MIKLRGTLFIVLLFSIVALFFCFATGPAGAAEKKEIVIGTPLPMTGDDSMAGVEQKWAYEQAFKDMNAKGGVFVKEFNKKLPVRLIVADAESNPGKAVSALERLVKVNKVDLLLSTANLPLGLPTSVAADKFHVYYHLTTVQLFPWREQHFKWSTDYFFDTAQAGAVPFEVIDSIPQADRPKNMALLCEDSPDGRGLGPFFREAAKKHHIELVFDEPLAVGAKDYTPQILKMKSKNVDGMILFAPGGDCITFVRQMKENGLSVKYLHGYKGTWGSEFWNALGKDAQYILADGFWSETYAYPMAKDIGERYFKQFNKRSVSIGLYYAMCQTLFTAIEKAGTLDSAKVKEAVLSMPFKQTVMGDIKYNSVDGTAIFPLGAFQWIDGQLKLVYPFVKSAYKVQMPPAK